MKGNPAAKTEKLRRLREYWAAFAEAVKEADTGLRFSQKPAGDNRGANESEIGVLFFDPAANTTSRVLELFPRVHAEFVKRIQEQR